MDCITSLRRVGVPQTGSSSGPVAGTRTVAGCRFRFRFAVGFCSKTKARRRQAVAEYLDGWVPLTVLTEQMVGKECWVWVRTSRVVSVAAAKDYVRSCPGYVAKSFRMLG